LFPHEEKGSAKEAPSAFILGEGLSFIIKDLLDLFDGWLLVVKNVDSEPGG